MSVLARPRPPAAPLAYLRQLRVVAARRHRFEVDRMVLVDRGDKLSRPQDDIARRLSHVTGWGITRLGAAEFGPGEVAQRIEILGGRPPALVVGPDILDMGPLALSAEEAALRLPWPALSVRYQRTPVWMPRILALWSSGGLARKMARAAWGASQALDGVVFSVQVHSRDASSGSPLEHPGPPLQYRSWSAPRHRALAVGSSQVAELRRLVAVFNPDMILVDPRHVPQLARCDAGWAASPT
ncbi:MAG TPA: hypothetical protein VNF75_00630 [Candidatus Dormibacteraeota bacterium]|nr:hypothetical protein [Candidatus Dormibacteraeota bacterium]